MARGAVATVGHRVSDYPPPIRRFWRTASALDAVELVVGTVSAGPDRVRALDALWWLREHVAELERRLRDAEITREVPT